MQIAKTVQSVSSRIEELYKVLIKFNEPEEAAQQINDILIYGDKIPENIISASWDYFAQRKKVIS